MELVGEELGVRDGNALGTFRNTLEMMSSILSGIKFSLSRSIVSSKSFN